MGMLHAARAKVANATTRKSSIAKNISPEYSDQKEKLELLSEALGKFHDHFTSVDRHWADLVTSQHDFANDMSTYYTRTDPIQSFSSSAKDSVSGLHTDISSPKEDGHPTKAEAARISAYKREVDDLLAECPDVELKFTETAKYDAKKDKLAKKGKDESRIQRSIEKSSTARQEYEQSVESLTSRMKLTLEKSPAVLANAQTGFWHVQEGAARVVSASSRSLAVGAKKAAIAHSSSSKAGPSTVTKDQLAGVVAPAPTPVSAPGVEGQASRDMSNTVAPEPTDFEKPVSSSSPPAGTRDLQATTSEVLPRQTTTTSSSVPPVASIPVVAAVIDSDPVPAEKYPLATEATPESNVPSDVTKSEEPVVYHDSITGDTTAASRDVPTSESRADDVVVSVEEPVDHDASVIDPHHSAVPAEKDSSLLPDSEPSAETPSTVVAPLMMPTSTASPIGEQADSNGVVAKEPEIPSVSDSADRDTATPLTDERQDVVKSVDILEPAAGSTSEPSVPMEPPPSTEISDGTSPVSSPVNEPVVAAGGMSTVVADSEEAPISPLVRGDDEQIPGTGPLVGSTTEPAVPPPAHHVPKDEIALMEEAESRHPIVSSTPEKPVVASPTEPSPPIESREIPTTEGVEAPVDVQPSTPTSESKDAANVVSPVPVQADPSAADLQATGDTSPATEMPVSNVDARDVAATPVVAESSPDSPVTPIAAETSTKDTVQEKPVEEPSPVKATSSSGGEDAAGLASASHSKSAEKTKFSTRVGEAFRKRKSLFSRRTGSRDAVAADVAKTDSPTQAAAAATAADTTTPATEASSTKESAPTKAKGVAAKASEKISLAADKISEKTSKATEKATEKAESKKETPTITDIPEEGVEVTPTPGVDTPAPIAPSAATTTPGTESDTRRSKMVEKAEIAAEKTGSAVKDAAEKVSSPAKKRKSLFSRNKSKKDLSPTS